MSASQSRSRFVATNACAVLAAALDERRQIFLIQLGRVRRRPTEPAIHDLRVATRRLIAVIDLVAEVVDVPGLSKRRRNLRTFLKGFNALRDVHIQVRALSGLRRSFPAAASVLRSVRTREQQLLRTTTRAVRAFDTSSLTAFAGAAEDALLHITLNPSLCSATRAVVLGALGASFARVALRKEMLNSADPRTIHRMRVAFKKYRYALEILSPLLPWMNATIRKQLNVYQTAMGNVQDAVVVLGVLSAFEAKRPVTGRMALFAMRQHLLRRRQDLALAFLSQADALESFWR